MFTINYTIFYHHLPLIYLQGWGQTEVLKADIQITIMIPLTHFWVITTIWETLLLGAAEWRNAWWKNSISKKWFWSKPHLADEVWHVEGGHDEDGQPLSQGGVPYLWLQTGEQTQSDAVGHCYGQHVGPDHTGHHVTVHDHVWSEQKQTITAGMIIKHWWTRRTTASLCDCFKLWLYPWLQANSSLSWL